MLLGALGCEPEMVRYCHYSCIDKNVESTADECGGARPKKGCDEPVKRAPVLGETVTVTGLDPDLAEIDEPSAVQRLGVIEEIAGATFFLDLEGREGFLGASVTGEDGALLGIVQGERDGRMWGRAVE
jgi:hypothetical protein